MPQKVKIDVPPKMVPLSEQKNKKTQLFCLVFFTYAWDLLTSFYGVGPAVLHVQFRTPFVASYFFIGTKLPCLNDRWPKLLWLGSPAWFERSPPHWHCAHSQWPRKFFVEWCFLGLSIILVLDWPLKKHLGFSISWCIVGDKLGGLLILDTSPSNHFHDGLSDLQQSAGSSAKNILLKYLQSSLVNLDHQFINHRFWTKSNVNGFKKYWAMGVQWF